MKKREWKGTPAKPDVCGAELKIGVSAPNEVRCELPCNHSGPHRSPAMTWNDPATPARKQDEQ